MARQQVAKYSFRQPFRSRSRWNDCNNSGHDNLPKSSKTSFRLRFGDKLLSDAIANILRSYDMPHVTCLQNTDISLPHQNARSDRLWTQDTALPVQWFDKGILHMARTEVRVQLFVGILVFIEPPKVAVVG